MFDGSLDASSLTKAGEQDEEEEEEKERERAGCKSSALTVQQ